MAKYQFKKAPKSFDVELEDVVLVCDGEEQKKTLVLHFRWTAAASDALAHTLNPSERGRGVTYHTEDVLPIVYQTCSGWSVKDEPEADLPKYSAEGLREWFDPAQKLTLANLLMAEAVKYQEAVAADPT